MLAGLAGNDALFGLSGNDVLKGGPGRDTLTGGAGKDAFVFDTTPNTAANVDVLADFSVKDDTVWLDNAVMKAVGKNGKLAKDAFVLGKKALDAEDRIVYDKASGNLFYDADGTGKIAAIKLAVLANKAKLELRFPGDLSPVAPPPHPESASVRGPPLPACGERAAEGGKPAQQARVRGR